MSSTVSARMAMTMTWRLVTLFVHQYCHLGWSEVSVVALDWFMCCAVWQVRYASLTEAVRLLGCFDAVTDIQPTPAVLADLKPPSEDSLFNRLFHELATLVVFFVGSWCHVHRYRCSTTRASEWAATSEL